MTSNHTDDELKQLIHDAIWAELPNEKYRDEMLEVDDIRLDDPEGLYTTMLVPNNLLQGFGSDWIESEVDGEIVRWKMKKMEGTNFASVLMEAYRKDS